MHSRLIAILVCLLLATAAFAAPPKKLSFQGRLTDGQGQPITGTRSIDFRIYDAATGGTLLWEENQDVTVTDGAYSAILGSVQAIDTTTMTFDAPYYLGIEVGRRDDGGQASAFMETISRDVGPLLEAALRAGIPLLVGSAGFAGGEPHLMGTVAVFRSVAQARGLRFKAAVIHAEVDKGYVKEKLRAGKVEPLGPVPELTEQEVDAAVRIVGQMGVEPFQRALERGAQVVIAGRANDPSMFAALPLMHGFDRGLGLHMAKILECGAIAAQPGSGSDAML